MRIEKRIVSITEFAFISGYSRAWIYELIKKNIITPTIISEKYYIDKIDYKHIRNKKLTN